MGNCIGAAFSHDEGDEEFKVWTVDEKLSSEAPLSKLCKEQLPLSEMLKPGEINHLIQKHILETPADDVAEELNVQRVKIVVNKKQLQGIMGREAELQLRHMVLQSLLRRAKKWRPSLAAIPEL